MKHRFRTAFQFATALLTMLLFGESRLFAGTVSYAYDSLNRLINVDYGNGAFISYTYDAAGNRLTYSGAVSNDTVAPAISITNPASGTFITTDPTINLGGIAADNSDVSLITWENDRGDMGTASFENGTWSINAIPLQSGANVILITAYDVAGNSSFASITVTFSPPLPIQLEILSYSNCVLSFNLTGPAGASLLIQSSSDLFNWIPLATRTIGPGGSIAIIDPNACSQAGRFYRAVGVFGPLGGGQALTKMSWIPAGTFVMGSATNEAARTEDETQHTVTLSKGFYIGQYLVTQADYLAVVGNNPSYFSTNNGYAEDLLRPVDLVTWDDATNFCALATQQARTSGSMPSGWSYRLPTEAEWEYACRAGTTTAFNFGNAIRGGMANFNDHFEYDATIGRIYVSNPAVPNLMRTSTVGSYAPNAYGLYDMHGNVAEWCQDRYGPYATGSVTDPQGAASGYHVMRGGSLGSLGEYCRSASRSNDEFIPSSSLNLSIGFRLVMAQERP